MPSNVDEHDARIQFSNQSAVTLITGQGENAAGFPDERVFDLHADGTLLAHRGVPAEPHPIDSAQLWSFRPVVQSPLEPGTYKIISSHARLFLDLAEDGDADHHGVHTFNIVFTRLQPLTSFR